MLRRAHHKLKATLTLSFTRGGRSTTVTRTIVLRGA